MVTSVAAKGLGVANMVRLGVLEAQGQAILTAPKPNHAYFARSDAALQEWSNEVTQAFKRGPNSIYTLVLSIFRSEVVNHLIQAGEFPSRPLPVVPSGVPVTSNADKHVLVISDSEEERDHVRRRRR